MSKRMKRRVAAATAVALLSISAVAAAAPGNSSGTDQLNAVPNRPADAGTAPAVGSGPTNDGPFCVSPSPCGAGSATPPGSALEGVTPAPAANNGANSSSGPNAFEVGSGDFVQSDAARRNPLSAYLRGPSDLSMWNLVAHVSAQKSGSAYVSIQTGLASLSVPLAASVPAAVPLPAAAWLFVAGALGLARKRKSKSKNKSVDAVHTACAR